ncbi:NAD(P)-binding domain-containing protein [Azospirillum sp. B506]|uniref:NAD(P)-binding domain-containing protein n=1 Tax=Azospirillum sp. B506 TaxID=137721 RepID=UPI00034BFF50|nr:NAD(P)-binding domain-containing protein [Azospirillum sp. B506]
MDVGFIGSGEMADAIMDRLRQAGHRLHHHRHGRSDFRDRAGACDVVMLLVPDDPAADAALFGDDGFGAALPPGALVIDLSRRSAAGAAANAARLAELGVLQVDAPVVSGLIPTAAITLGGSDAACARAEPLLRLFSHEVVRAGGPGAGQRMRPPEGDTDDPDGLHRLLRLMAFDGPTDSVQPNLC